MHWTPSHCFNRNCHFYRFPFGVFIKKGFFRAVASSRPIRRYQCKKCGKTFSSRSFSPSYRLKKPFINRPLFELLSSGVTQRRAAKILGIHRKTVDHRLNLFGELARREHNVMISFARATEIHIDELASFEHSQLKPLTIGIAVSSDNKILSAEVGIVPPTEELLTLSLQKYGSRPDQREETMKTVLAMAKRGRKRANFDFYSKNDALYINLIQRFEPRVRHFIHRSNRRSVAGQSMRTKTTEHDPLFYANHIMMKLRADISRLRLRFWGTTKKMANLQKHLYIYIAYHNGYNIL